MTMITTIDQAGRLVIPRDIRRQAGIEPGMALDVRVEHGRIAIEPMPIDVRLERRGRFTVAVPADGAATLTAAVVETTRRQVRRRTQPG
jgi:AbrB family looped-hinge helix DNA binding protein